MTFCDATNYFPGNWCLRIFHRNSILMMCHYLNLGRANSVDANFSCDRNNGKHYPDLGSNTSSVCNLRCYFVGRLVVASQKVGHFLRQGQWQCLNNPKCESFYGKIPQMIQTFCLRTFGTICSHKHAYQAL